MSIESTLSQLLEKGIGPITLGKPPTNSAPPGAAPEFYIRAPYNFPTGSLGNAIEAAIQCAGDSIPDCLNSLAQKVEQLDKLQSKPSAIVSLAKPKVVKTAQN